MANTLIQIKRSSSTAVPASLSAAEVAYSYNSDKLFIGSSDGTQVIAIGGKFFVDQQNTIFAQANAAYTAANSGPSVTAAFNAANAAFANANTTHTLTVASFAAANASFANGNTNFTTLQSAFGQANTGRDHANVAFGVANGAYNTANTKFNSSGGTISGSVTITGDLIITGNNVYSNASTLRISDPLIYLAGNNYTTDAVDIGFVGNYVNATGSNVHTGLYREHATKEYYLFYGYDKEPDNNHIDPAGNNFTVAVLNADIKTSNLSLGGVNAISWLNATFAAANAAFANANGTHTLTIAAFTQANTALSHANAAFANANTTHTLTIASFAAANAAFANANGTHTLTVASFGAANAAFLAANSAFNKANGSQDAANLTSGIVSAARIVGSYANITGVGVLAGGTWQANTITVPYGGTGMTTFTTNGILYGNSAGAIKVTLAGTDGQVLVASASGVPGFAHLDGGTF